MEKIRIKYIGDTDRIEKITAGDWIDLRAAEDVEIKAGECRVVPLNVAMQLPEGYEAIMASRSSTFKKFGVFMANGIGVIDEEFCGDNDQWGLRCIRRARYCHQEERPHLPVQNHPPPAGAGADRG